MSYTNGNIMPESPVAGDNQKNNAKQEHQPTK